MEQAWDRFPGRVQKLSETKNKKVMCLSNISKQKVAERDIVVFKYVYWDEDRKAYLTPFQHAKIIIGRTYTSALDVQKKKGGNIVGVGLYSFRNKRDVFDNARIDKMIRHQHTFHVVRCIIPKGSLYYTGIFDDSTPSYVSNTLTYEEIIKSI